MENQKPKVLLVVEGGCIQAVYSNIPGIDVIIADRDIEGGDEESIVTVNGEEMYLFGNAVDDIGEYAEQIINKYRELEKAGRV